MVGISNLKAISSMFNKFTADTEDKILIELFRIYCSNPNRKRISIADLMQSISIPANNLSFNRIIRLMSEALANVCPTSRFLA